jgi:hypothetical protein
MELTTLAIRGSLYAAVIDFESFDPANDDVYLVDSSTNTVTKKRWQSALRLGYWEPHSETVDVDGGLVEAADSKRAPLS